MRGRATGRLCVVIRGVVSDAVPCLLTGVICDLPFNVVGLPKKMGGIIAHPSMICQSPHAAFLRRKRVVRTVILRHGPRYYAAERGGFRFRFSFCFLERVAVRGAT